MVPLAVIKRDKLEPDLEIDAERFLIQLVAQLTQAAAVAAPQLPGGRQAAQHCPAPLPKRASQPSSQPFSQPSSASTAASGLKGLALPCHPPPDPETSSWPPTRDGAAEV